MSTRVVIVGGGWSGCSAALAAKKAGADEVIILERTDELLGSGLVGGIMRNNGRFTATEELIAMGAGEIFAAIDGNYLHSEIQFPGHDHASLYNVATMEPIIRSMLGNAGVDLELLVRASARLADATGLEIRETLGRGALPGAPECHGCSNHRRSPPAPARACHCRRASNWAAIAWARHRDEWTAL